MASPAAVGSTFSGRSKKTPTSTTTVCAPFVKAVCLQKWWLIKVERDSKGRRGLGVAGLALRERQETRAFFSAAIAKRHDALTLETTDGITITLSGLFNRSHTAENGFPSEVGDRFCFGFPHNWEEYGGQLCGEESGNGAISSESSNLDGFDSSSVDGTDGSVPICLDDLPVTFVRDLLMSSDADSRVLRKGIMNDIVQYFVGNEATGKGKREDNYGSYPLMTQNFAHKQVSRNHDKAKFDDMCKDDGSSQHSTDSGKVKLQKTAGECETGIDVDSLSGGVVTRSMSRLSSQRNKPENNLSPRTYVARRLTEVFGDQCGLNVITGDGSSKRHGTTVSDADVEANGTPRSFTSTGSNNQYGGALSWEEMNERIVSFKSSVRRSDRLRKV